MDRSSGLGARAAGFFAGGFRPDRWLRQLVWVLAVLVLPPALAQARDAAAPRGEMPPEDVLIFQSRPAGTISGGSQSLGASHFPGHSFRVLQRTQISRISVVLRSFSSESVFAALYRIRMPLAAADVAGDSALLATTLLDVPGDGVVQEVEAPLSAVLEPGWYAILVGVGRYGSTADGFVVSLPSVDTTTTPQSYGQYSVNATNNQMSLTTIKARYSLFGHVLPPSPVPEGEFHAATAHPYAWMYSNAGTDYQGAPIHSSAFLATRFSVDQSVKLQRAGLWAFGGSGNIFAAILRMNGPAGLPPNANSPAFQEAIAASTLIDAGAAGEAYYGSLDNVELAPGHYALIFGSGKFGATGQTSALVIGDSQLRPGVLRWTGTQWLPEGVFNFDDYWMELAGIVPEQAEVTLGANVAVAGTGESVTFTATVSGEHAAPGDGQVTITASTGETCTVSTPSGGAGQTVDFQCAIGFASVGPRTLAGRFSESATHASAESMPLPFLAARIADLSVSIDDAMQVAEPGGAVEYLVQVRNAGPDPASGTAIVVTADPALVGANWSCVPVGGASCPQAQGSGEIGQIATLPVGGGLDYLFAGQFTLAMPPTLIATAQVGADIAAPNFVLDRQPGNNQATDLNLSSAIFGNGFEP